MGFNQFRFNARRFNGGRVYNPAPIVYYVYAGNSSGGPVDYDNPIGQTPFLTFTALPLGHSTSTRFGVRTHSNVTGLTERNTDAQVRIDVGAGGTDVTRVPQPPVALTVRAAKAGGYVVEWSYPYLDTSRLPTGFHIYRSTGGTLSYGAPVATVNYGPAGLPVTLRKADPSNYRETLSGLSNGVLYSVGVRAFNAAGEELNIVAVQVVGDTVAPLNVANLTATLTSG